MFAQKNCTYVKLHEYEMISTNRQILYSLWMFFGPPRILHKLAVGRGPLSAGAPSHGTTGRLVHPVLDKHYTYTNFGRKQDLLYSNDMFANSCHPVKCAVKTRWLILYADACWQAAGSNGYWCAAERNHKTDSTVQGMLVFSGYRIDSGDLSSNLEWRNAAKATV